MSASADTLHPVLNLASARLATGSAARPEVVSPADIDKAKRGPLLGIPGAPAVIAKPLSQDESAWTVCDDMTTTVIAGHTRSISTVATTNRTYWSLPGRRARRRRTCCTTVGGRKSISATPASCGRCDLTVSSHVLFRGRCLMPFPKRRQSLRHTSPGAGAAGGYRRDCGSERWCGDTGRRSTISSS